jgi:hypothetical protein
MTDPKSEIVGFAERVRERVSEGDGSWLSCTGCYETSDGQNVNGYPHSETFGCILGSGCRECGGIGAVWDNTDYEDWARWMIDQENRARATLKEQSNV